MSLNNNYIICVFHFNRGAYLENLIKSIERHSTAPTVIFDDCSNDRPTLNILKKISKTYEIINSEPQRATERRTGGLHSNMSKALDIAEQRGFDRVLMIQDDMQLVRDITSKDMKVLDSGYTRPNASLVIGAGFFKRYKDSNGLISKVEIVSPGLYEISTRGDDGAMAVGSYSDTGFFSVSLYRSLLGELVPGEQANQLALREKNVRMSTLVNPLMHFTPMPISFRGRYRHWRDRFSDWVAGAGVHSIKSLEGERLAGLMQRDPTILPYAEDFLSAPSLPKVVHWPARGGRSNLIACKGWKQYAYKLIWTDLRALWTDRKGN